MWRELKRLAEYAAEQRRREFGVNFVFRRRNRDELSIPLLRVHETMACRCLFGKQHTVCVTAEVNDRKR